MLSSSQIQTKFEEKTEVHTLTEVRKLFDDNVKIGGPIKLKLLTYNSISKGTKFSFQPPAVFTNQQSISKYLTLDLETGKGEVYSYNIDITTKILVKSNNLVTSLLIGSLISMRDVKVAYVRDIPVNLEKEPQVEFLKVLRIYDPIDEAKKKANQERSNKKPEEKVTEASKDEAQVLSLSDVAKKDDSKEEKKAEEPLRTFRLETKDGSLFVVDHLIMK